MSNYEIVPQGYEILGGPTGIPNEVQLVNFLAERARVAYKSVYRFTDPASVLEGNTQLIKRLVFDVKHESVIEHACITVRFTLDRGLSHELVRHRIGAYTQESTRYCNYTKERHGKTIKVVCPGGVDPEDAFWKAAMTQAADSYFAMIDSGKTPQQARSVLPTCLATTVDATYNLRVWRHVFTLRCGLDPGSKPHPDIKRLMLSLLEDFGDRWPALFSDLAVKAWRQEG